MSPRSGLGDHDDDALAARAAQGDRRALELLLEKHADRIHAVCRRVVADREDALDATQEAMIAVARGITRFDGRAAFSTWCYRVATNAALDRAYRQMVNQVNVPGFRQLFQRLVYDNLDPAMVCAVEVPAADCRRHDVSGRNRFAGMLAHVTPATTTLTSLDGSLTPVAVRARTRTK